MNITREEAQQILDALEHTSNYMKCTEAVFSQVRMYLDMTLMPSLAKHSDAAITLLQSRLAEGEQEPTCPDCEAVVMYECVACSKSNYPEATSTSNSTPLEAAATKLLKHWDAKHMFATAVLIEQIRVILPQPYAQQAP